MSELTVIKKNGKYIFKRDGVHLALTIDQVRELRRLCDSILGYEPPMKRNWQESYEDAKASIVQSIEGKSC